MDSIYGKLLTYSYNIVGSYEDAKDLVQDIVEKYIGLDKSKLQNETNFLIKSVINHSINFKQRNKRTSEFGVWLPEPVATELAENKLIRENAARYSLLVVMEKLNAKERAVFILKAAFDYSHEEIAEILGVSTENSRQLFSRAKKVLGGESFNVKQKQIPDLNKYIDAIVGSDIKTLKGLLKEDIKLYADGGNKVKVVHDFVIGKEAGINLMLFVYNSFLKNLKFEIVEINLEPAICFYKNDKLYNCQVFKVVGGKIDAIYSIVDPAKLKKLHV